MPAVAMSVSEASDQSWSSERVDELCATTIRAIAHDPDVRFRRQVLHRGQAVLPFQAPHLHPPATDTDFMSWRGAADALPVPDRARRRRRAGAAGRCPVAV